MNRILGSLGARWGTVGVVTLLSFAMFRLGKRAGEAWQMGLTGGQWALVVIVCIAMAYSEGYRGFQLRFSPRTAARIRHLRDNPQPLHVLFAPVFAMGFFHATRRTKIVAYGGTIGIVILVTILRFIAQPWRGIIDAGVVVGLGWGVISLLFATVGALTQPEYDASPEVP